MSGIAEEPGADEEVCLLPDTEREISEADKAEAEKVLAEKRKQAEGKSIVKNNKNLRTEYPGLAECRRFLYSRGAYISLRE